MQSCPSCGLDVESPGLCAECENEKQKTQTGIKKLKKTPQKSSKTLIMFITSHLLMAAIGFLLSYLIFNSFYAVKNTSVSADQRTDIKDEQESDLISSEVPEDVHRFDLNSRTIHPPMIDKDEYVGWMLKNTKEEEYFIKWRWDCVQDLISWRSIRDDRIKEAFLRTPRENFIRNWNKSRAYEHAYMPIGYGATITDPWIVSLMTTTISPEPQHKVLEIGTGSGYQSALLSELSNNVYSIEIIEELAIETNDVYKSYEANYPEYKNIRRVAGDGYYGWPEKEPFDRIIVTCAIDHIPPPLLKQLAIGGIMVIPVGPPSGQKLLKVSKYLDGDTIYFDRENLLTRNVSFISFRDMSGKRYTENENGSE